METKLDLTNDFSSTCDTCIKYKKRSNLNLVDFSMAAKVNEAVEVDIKRDQSKILHLRNHAKHVSYQFYHNW